MFPTVEVRWFYRGTIPPQVSAWFEQKGREPAELAERTDFYLCLPGKDALGIKLREGRIEIKQRQQNLGDSRFHEQVAGRVECWRKWSFLLAENVDTLNEVLFPTGTWIGVQKKRRLRRYRLAGTLQREMRTGENWSPQGCNFELTELGLEGSRWWSVCLEAYGTETTLQKNLALVAGHIMASNQPPILEVNDSYSYPHWLGVARDK